MIEPILKGADLLRDIESAAPGPRGLAMWWLGQSGYALKTASGLVYIDLYLSEHLTAKYANSPKPHIRMTAAPIRGHEITNARIVLASHKHSDHLDPGTLPGLFAASLQAKLVLPAALVEHAVGLGLDRDRLLPMRGDDTLEVDGIHIHALPAAHPEFEYTPDSGHAFLGYVIDFGDIRVYHSGDTVVYAGLRDRLIALSPHVALLPINGRAGGEGTPPNMNAFEAIALAREAKIPLVIPHHYDMFTFNTADPAKFSQLAEDAGQAVYVLRPGERFMWQV